GSAPPALGSVSPVGRSRLLAVAIAVPAVLTVPARRRLLTDRGLYRSFRFARKQWFLVGRASDWSVHCRSLRRLCWRRSPMSPQSSRYRRILLLIALVHAVERRLAGPAPGPLPLELEARQVGVEL